MNQKQKHNEQSSNSLNTTIGQLQSNYIAPRVLSAEDLEAKADACSPTGVGGTGKSTATPGCEPPTYELGS